MKKMLFVLSCIMLCCFVSCNNETKSTRSGEPLSESPEEGGSGGVESSGQGEVTPGVTPSSGIVPDALSPAPDAVSISNTLQQFKTNDYLYVKNCVKGSEENTWAVVILSNIGAGAVFNNVGVDKASTIQQIGAFNGNPIGVEVVITKHKNANMLEGFFNVYIMGKSNQLLGKGAFGSPWSPQITSDAISNKNSKNAGGDEKYIFQ